MMTKGGRVYWKLLHKGRGCDDKIRYSTIESAENARDEMKRLKGVELNIYMCQFCHRYHLGGNHRKVERDE
jgi:hypothetical protein